MVVVKEKASTIKGKNIHSACRLKKHTRSKYEIEIVRTNAIEGGVEVFARAWKNGRQIGFGRDGSVDIERFRIFNPPILVADEQNWTHERTVNFFDGKETVQIKKHFREDPEEAVLQVIEHNLSVMKNIFSDEAIIKAKQGNTTSTFYPASGTSSPVDGRLAVENASTWAGARDAANATYVSATSVDENSIYTYNDGDGSPWHVMRMITLFDTSSIPDTDEISAATASLYINGVGGNSDNDGQDYIGLVSSAPASTSSLAAGDFDSFGTTLFAPSLDYGSVTTSAYNDFALNATGIAAIDKTGISKFGWREGHDIEDAPIATSSINVVNVSHADHTGTAQDPKLVVEHSAAPVTSERDAEITGQDTSNSERDAEVSGVDTATDERSAETTGTLTTNDERDAEVHGQVIITDERSAEVHGVDTTNDERGAETTGQETAQSERPAEVHGVDTTTSERDSEVIGADTANDERASEVHGADTAQDTRAAEVHGSQIATSERPSEITGKASATDERSAETHGQASASDERDAEIHGQVLTNSERSAETHGVDSVQTERPAEVHGSDTANAERSAETHGKALATDERSAETHGVDSANDERSSEVHGSIDVTDERPAEVSGVDTASSERGAAITGGVASPYSKTTDGYSRVNQYVKY